MSPIRSTISLLFVLLLATPAHGNMAESHALKDRVRRLESKMSKLSKGALKKFYGQKYSDANVKEARHECYLALLEQVELRADTRKKKKNLKKDERELKKLRSGYGKLVKPRLSAKEVEACEVRRTPICEGLNNIPDGHDSRYYRSEIDIMRNQVRSVLESISAHQDMAAKSLKRCHKKLGELP